MNKWQQRLAEYYSLAKELSKRLKEGQGELRFDRHFIAASDIAEQYFCEKKVEMQYLHGKIETEDKAIGTEGHENLLQDTVRIKTEELWRKIHSEKPVFAPEMHLLARYGEVVLAGRPDLTIFHNGRPLVMLEYKFTKSGIAYTTQHVQARAYGLILRAMGFDTSHLFYAIVLADPGARRDRELKRRVVDAVLNKGPKECVLNIENARIHLHRFIHTDAEKDLDWAIDYWKSSREAVPTSNPNKCKSCEYRMECERSVHRGSSET
jgi:CRISPR/Cas system-associated exonuclease Cas4 (RecB family)